MVQNPRGYAETNTVASIEEDTKACSKTVDEISCDKDRGTLYVGTTQGRENPMEELDRVARDNLATMNMQFQGLHKQYVSEYCNDELVREADTLIQGDMALEKNHSTFQSYNAGGSSSCRIKNVISAHDDIVKKEIEKYAGNRPLLPERYDCSTQGTALVDRMKQLDEQMKKAIETHDSDFKKT